MRKVRQALARRKVRKAVARKRDGAWLSPREIEAAVGGYARGDIPEDLATAFLEAVYNRGLDPDETFFLTRVLLESGTTLPLKGISGPRVDKHSTGGVADGVSLVFAPLAASLGLAVAKLSGRGLGHTGGTIDKLESIPGFRTDLSPDEIERQANEVGCVIAAQTEDLAPADGALYALRDATGTVDSPALIAASVMSKKLAVGSDLILLDVKAGSGAFMKTPRRAAVLVDICLTMARAWDRMANAAVTDMSQPLGDSVGNALEVREAVEVLRGERSGRLAELTIEFVAAAQAALRGITDEEGRSRARDALSGGEAAATFARMVEAQGGDPRVVDDPDGVLPSARVTRRPVARSSGFVQAIDAEAVGRAAMALGAGRRRKEDPVDPAVGVILRPKIGDRVEAGEPIGEIHARDDDAASTAADAVAAAISFGESRPEPPPLVYGWRGT